MTVKPSWEYTKSGTHAFLFRGKDEIAWVSKNYASITDYENKVHFQAVTESLIQGQDLINKIYEMLGF